MPWDVRQKDDEYCVYKKGTDTIVPGGCHAERADAIKHVRALYANEPSMKYSVLTFADALLPNEGEDPNIAWVRAWRYSVWDHPKYGKVEITPATGQQFKSYFDEGTLGREHLVNYDHGSDAAKGGKAAGKILAVDPRDDGIYYQVKFTDTAKKEIDAGEWRYLSPEFDDWVNPETGDVFEDMMFDLAVTNTPFFKGMPPINFSELYDLTQPVVTVTTTTSTEGGKTVDELLKQFAEKLGVSLPENATDEQILEAATELNATIEPLRKAKFEGEKQRTFREAFPEEYKEMDRLRKGRVEGEARQFAEGYRRFTIKQGENEYKSALGFSELVVDQITEVYKKFSDKSFAPADLEKLLDEIGNHGVVDYSEAGSSRGLADKSFNEDPKLAFSEAVQEVMVEDNLEYEKAISVAQMKFPDLYEAYQRAIPRI